MSNILFAFFFLLFITRRNYCTGHWYILWVTTHLWWASETHRDWFVLIKKVFFFLIQQTTWIWFEDNHTNWSNESRDEIYQPQILGFNLYFDDENRHNEYVIDCTKPNVWSDDYLDDESEPRVSRWWQPFF